MAHWIAESIRYRSSQLQGWIFSSTRVVLQPLRGPVSTNRRGMIFGHGYAGCGIQCPRLAIEFVK